MIRINEITSLTEFQRNTREHILRLKKTGRPEVLTVNGKPEVVVQDAASYQKMVEALEAAETLPVLRKSLQEAEEGQGIPAKKVLEKMRDKLGLKR